jgi:hypothetical protein
LRFSISNEAVLTSYPSGSHPEGILSNPLERR